MSGSSQSQDEAVFKPSRWPGVIWAVPVAALGIVAWLGISAALDSGPTVTVTFPIVGGLKPGSTKVEYKGFQVGQVADVWLAKSLGDMEVKIDFDSDMAGHLGKGTKYWIGGASFSLSNIDSVKALISGPFIGIDPRPGKTTARATGLSKPPVLKDEPQGETLTLIADRLTNLSPGSPVLFKGFKVGEIRGISLAPDGSHFDIYAFIQQGWERLLNRNSRFWDAGAVHLSAGGGGPGLQLASIPALFMGAVAFDTPAGGPPAKPAQDGASFRLYASESAARAAPELGAVSYRVVFPGGPHGLQEGAPVQLEGSPAGVVNSVTAQYDPARGAMQTIVTLSLQPEKINYAGPPWNFADPAPRMDALLNTLIMHGLRAEMASSVPVLGGKIVQLDLVKGQPQADLQPGSPPVIPSLGQGGGIGGVMAQLNDILATVNAMPLDQIAANIRQATSAIAGVTRSPRTREALDRLDRTVAHIDDITRDTDAQLPAILAQVKQSASDAQGALDQVQGMLSANGPANEAPDATDLPHALYELSLAARSLRQLTDFLNSHPDALIAGR